MKKIVYLIILAILVLLFVNNKYEAETITTSYNLSDEAKQLKEIENININITNAEINVIRGGVSDISITRNSTKTRIKSVSYVSNYYDNAIEVKENYENIDEKVPTSNDHITIRIPDEIAVNNLTVTTKAGIVNLENINAETVKINGKKEMDVNLLSGKFTNMDIKTPSLIATVQDVEFRQMLSYDITSGEITETNVAGIEEKIKAKETVKYNSINSFTLNTTFEGAKAKVYYAINKDKNYIFKDSNNNIKVNGIKKDDLLENTYNYEGNKTEEKATINLNNNKTKVVLN